jgi:glycosyltransferase involved in cell wall biosynthesis
MHVAQIGFFLDPRARAPARLLEDWYSLGHIADAVASSGTRVSVIQASQHAQRFRRGAADYYFLTPNAGASLAATPEFGRLLVDLAPDVFHVHGLAFPDDVRALREAAPRIPILLQDHADRVPRFWRRPRLARGLARADGVSFCAHAQAEPFHRARLLPESVEVFEIAESSSTFGIGDREAARAATGIGGDPALLWVGHLDANKDPLTVLEGVALATSESPRLELTCVFAAAPLRREVERRIARDPRLSGRVRLAGEMPHERIEALMHAADLFILGSHREGSGYSLIEALSCGLPPVVTDIPSFCALTGDGAVGQLWRAGDPGDCARALRDAIPRARVDRAAVRAHFERRVSFDAIGRRFAAAYSILAERGVRAG